MLSLRKNWIWNVNSRSTTVFTTVLGAMLPADFNTLFIFFLQLISTEPPVSVVLLLSVALEYLAPGAALDICPAWRILHAFLKAILTRLLIFAGHRSYSLGILLEQCGSIY